MINDRGLLFLEETKRRNIATCLKDKAFLKFFYKRMERNANTSPYYNQGYSFVSKCGREVSAICHNITHPAKLNICIFTRERPR